MNALSFDGLAQVMEEIEASPPQALNATPSPTAEENYAASSSKPRKVVILTSHQYRKRLREMMEEEGLHSKAKFYVYFFATVLPSKRRLLQVAQTKKRNGSMDAALRFIATRCQQTPGQCSDDEFPFMHVTTSNPSLAALIWKYKTKPADRTADRMIKNLWFGYLNLDEPLQAEHKAFERAFWNRVFRTSRDSAECQLGFRETMYGKKAADSYPLLTREKKIAFGGRSKISKAQLSEWLST